MVEQVEGAKIHYFLDYLREGKGYGGGRVIKTTKEKL
jgi:hypothetical protein